MGRQSSHDCDIGVGLDSSIIKLNSNLFSSYLYLIQSTDFFYPLINSPFIMGAIAAANVLSDIYAVGVINIDTVQIIIGITNLIIKENEQNIIIKMLIKGFKSQIKIANTNVSKIIIKYNPWMTIGGVVTSVCTKEEFIMPTQAEVGDILILTKPLGTQMAVTIRSWIKNEERIEYLKKMNVDHESVKKCINSAIQVMATLNRKAATLMHKYNAHASTDVTGYGLLGHANNLVKYQTNNVNFEINLLPILYPLGIISNHPGNRFYNNVNKGEGIETSGGLLICLPKNNVSNFIKDMNGYAWIIGKVTQGKKIVQIKQNPDILHVSLKETDFKY